MGSCIRWLFTHGSTIIHDCLRLSPCSDERRTNYMAILSPAIPSYHTTIFYIHDTIQHLTNVVGTDKRRDIINGSITNFLELPDTCRTSVVYVSSNQSLSIHTYNISMAEKSLGKEERFFIGLFLLSTCIPYLNRWCGEVWGQCFWNEYHMLWYFSGYLGYLVLAHYIHTHLTWSRSKRFIIGTILMVIGAVLTIYSFYSQAIPGETLSTPVIEIGWAFCTINCVLLTAGTFLMFTCINSSKAPRIITEMSKLSYGMYLMHIFWLGLWATVFKYTLALPTVAAIPCIAISTFICCFITSKLISFIPGSKWIIG